ncbi:methylamine utilization protein [Alteromonas flava]|uniref:methylamine utilization protein n=1 Tax=Alteromonas flava TaxID=2048003 RepID=UPI000C28C6D3|nr:methylamine utilization protein [Alteromonas flava]
MRWRAFGTAIIGVAGVSLVFGGELTATVVANDGSPLTNIAVLAKPLSASDTAAPAASLSAVMDQVNRQFVPHTLVVQRGTKVSFPNSDSVKHHVYSFSPAKTFELKLYSELDVDPLLFETAGEVELGCNIHDWMLGYIYVADTPFFGQTNAQGKVTLTLPEGDYLLSIWHPRIRTNDRNASHPISVSVDQTETRLTLTEDLWPSLGDYEASDGLSDYD